MTGATPKRPVMSPDTFELGTLYVPPRIAVHLAAQQETTRPDGTLACRRHQFVTQITGTKYEPGLPDVQRQRGPAQRLAEQPNWPSRTE
jgi:hypothetical protein